MPGRVGDSALIGCGGYADNRICAVSVTGHGESLMKTRISSRICNLIEYCKLGAQEAGDLALKEMEEKVQGYGGAIVIDFDGNIGCSFTTD